MVARLNINSTFGEEPGDGGHGRARRAIAASSASAEADNQTVTRYCDQPMSLRTRLCGMGGVLLVGLLILGGALFSWATYRAVQPPPTMSLFDVAPPAAPPEPSHEIPPGPEEIQKEKQQSDPAEPELTPTEIQIATASPVPVPVAKPVPDPGPPVEQTTAPESKPVPPAPRPSNARPTWEGLVLAALNKVKRYPREASFRRQQGVPYIRFVMNREGKVLSARLERSSGFPALDEEAVALPKRAQPLPRAPEEVGGETFELVVPVEFFMR